MTENVMRLHLNYIGNLIHYLKQKRTIVFAIVCFSLAATVYAYFRLNTVSLPREDETFYLGGVIHWNDLEASWSPIYTVFYYLCALIVGFQEAEPVFITGAFVLCFILVPFCVFHWVSFFGGSAYCGLIAAVWALTSCVNLPMNPRVHCFNFVLISTLFFFRKLLFQSMFQTFLYGFFCAVILFSRSENFVYLVVLLGALFFEKNTLAKRLHEYATLLGGFALTFICLFFYWGSPFENERTVLAFVDHFYWRNSALVNATMNLEHLPYDATFLLLGSPKSLLEIFFNNFTLVQNHILQNIQSLPFQFFRALRPHPFFTADHSSQTTLFFEEFGSLFAGVVLLLISPGRTVSCPSPRAKAWVLIWLGAIAKCLLLVLIMQPFFTYLTDVVFLFYISLAVIVAGMRFPVKNSGPFHSLWILVFFVWIGAQAHTIHPEFERPDDAKTSFSEIKSLQLPSNQAMFSYGAVGLFFNWRKSLNFYDYYIGSTKKGMSFSQIVAKPNVQLVFIDDDLYRFERERLGKNGLSDFETHYASLGFRRLYGTTKGRLYQKIEFR